VRRGRVSSLLDLAKANGWSSLALPVTPGKHRVEVRVPLAAFRGVARARRDITVAAVIAGEPADFIYDAPDTPGSLGAIRPADEPYVEIARGRTLLILAVLVGLTYQVLREVL